MADLEQNADSRLQAILTGKLKPTKDDHAMLKDYLQVTDDEAPISAQPVVAEPSIADLRKADDSAPIEPMSIADLRKADDSDPTKPSIADLRKADDSIPVNPTPLAQVADASSDTPDFDNSQSEPTPLNQPPQTTIQGPVTPVTAQIKPEANPLDNPELNDAAIKAAQHTADLRRLNAGVGEAFATVSASNRNSSPFYQNLRKDADQPVQDILQRREGFQKKLAVANSLMDQKLKSLSVQEATQALDPNSQVSKSARAMLLTVFPEAKNIEGFDTLSAKEAKDYIQHMAEAQAKIKSAEAQKEYAKGLNEERRTDRQTKIQNDRVTKFAEALDPNKARGGQLAVSQGNFNRAENLQGLVNKAGAGFNLDPRETEEFAIGLARLISGAGATSRSQVEALVPTSIRGNINKTIEWITNTPKGKEQQEFIKRMYGAAVREKEIARQQVKNAQLERVAGFEDLPQETRENVMWDKGISPDEYASFKKARRGGSQSGADFTKVSEAMKKDSNLNPVKASTQVPQYDADVLGYAKTHNLTPEQALNVKKSRMGIQ